MAEIERDNINVQTMAGRREKARQGGWNGAKAPYGYKIEDGKLVISPTEAEHIRIIFEKYVTCETRIESVKKQKMTKESVYESLRLFAKLYDKMNDHQKKSFVNSFIDSIDLYPNKGRKNGCVIKMIHFKFPVSYGGMEVYDVMPPLETTDETVCLLTKE